VSTKPLSLGARVYFEGEAWRVAAVGERVYYLRDETSEAMTTAPREAVTPIPVRPPVQLERAVRVITGRRV
jgi:hypothetical protein